MRTHSTASPRAGRVRVLRYPGGSARVGCYRGRADTAQITVTGCVPPEGVMQAALDQAVRAGFRAVLTNPLPATDAARFRAAGFEPHATLHLLRHELAALDRPALRTRRVSRRNLERLVSVDDDAFGAFWRLGAAGLHEAVVATPRRRVRTVAGPDGPVGYAITGLAGTDGYLQRLAVHRGAQRQGVGRSLVLDGLRWLRRHGAGHALVNTQEGNTPALRLYESVGFRRLPTGLAVLGRALH